MFTAAFTSDVLATSVVAVPPLARHADLSLNHDANQAIMRHLEAGGIRTVLYGGNANLYHVAVSEYGPLLEELAAIAGDETLVIPAAGPAYGMMMDQAAILADFSFPTTMVLPQRDITTSAGVAAGIRHFAERTGKPAVLYIKHENYIEIEDVRRLIEDGVISIIKYAIVRDDPAKDDALRRLVEVVDPRRIMSGIGEQPAIDHLCEFGLGGFTSGCVCIAPRLSMNMLRALQAGDVDTAEKIRQQFRPLEDLRNAMSPIRVLHAAVGLAGVADTGPLSPLLTDVPQPQCADIETAARELLTLNESPQVLAKAGKSRAIR